MPLFLPKYYSMHLHASPCLNHRQSSQAQADICTHTHAFSPVRLCSFPTNAVNKTEIIATVIHALSHEFVTGLAIILIRHSALCACVSSFEITMCSTHKPTWKSEPALYGWLDCFDPSNRLQWKKHKGNRA